MFAIADGEKWANLCEEMFKTPISYAINEPILLIG
jgi:hypothetical protein